MVWALRSPERAWKNVAEAGLRMPNQDQRRPALPVRLTSAERDFFLALRRLVDASGLSPHPLADMTSAARSPSAEASEHPEYTATQWRHWLNGQSLPPRKAVRGLVEALAMADTDAGNLVELWALAFRPTPYPQEPGGAPARQELPPDESPVTGRTVHVLGLDLPGSGHASGTAWADFSHAYRQLSSPAARMFRLLSVHPGPDVSLQAAASLAAVTVDQARTALDELAKAHLADQSPQERFTCQDLIRAHAAEQARAREPAPELEEALGRLLDHYAQTMVAAVSLAYPASLSVPVPAPRPGVLPESFESDDQARAWCHAELLVVQSLTARAADRGLDVYCWQIPSVMAPFMVRSGLLQDFLGSQRIALAAALRLGDPVALGHAHYHYAHACALLGEIADSDGHLHDALQSFTKAGDQASAARTLNGMAQLLMQQGEYPRALDREKEALRLRLALGDRDAVAHSEDTIGSIYSRLGEYDLALRHCHRSLDLSRETGARLLAADALTTLGFVHLALGDHKRAIASYMEVLAIYRQAGERTSIAAALTGLGDAQQTAGDSTAARASWQQALALVKNQLNADDQPVRARLDKLLPPS
jgi:tetratricopeptide (TPR) repeat protein